MFFETCAWKLTIFWTSELELFARLKIWVKIRQPLLAIEERNNIQASILFIYGDQCEDVK